MSLIKEFDEATLCTYYVLPLLKCSRYSFVYFKDCYLLNTSELLVKCAVIDDVDKYTHMPHYVTSYVYDDVLHILFKIPEEFEKDVQLFLDGKYSKLSETAKHHIKTYSKATIIRHLKDQDRWLLDETIQLIDRDPILRRRLEADLNVYIDDEWELYDKPDLSKEIRAF